MDMMMFDTVRLLARYIRRALFEPIFTRAQESFSSDSSAPDYYRVKPLTLTLVTDSIMTAFAFTNDQVQAELQYCIENYVNWDDGERPRTEDEKFTTLLRQTGEPYLHFVYWARRAGYTWDVFISPFDNDAKAAVKRGIRRQRDVD